MKVNAKPLSELPLEQCLKVASTPFKSAPQQIISNDDNDEPSTFVLQTGVIEIYRRSDELLIGIATAPFILGLTAGMLDYSKEYRVVAKNPCTGFYLPASTSLQLIQQSSLERSFRWLSRLNPFWKSGQATGRK